MIQKVFNRYEKKYLLNQVEYDQMREALQKYMVEDQYGWHTIRNIYYDTRDNELIRTSIEKPKYKEKFRIRCYGAPTEASDFFLEIKKKYNGLVNKRRKPLNYEEMKGYLSAGQRPMKDQQIFSEVDYFLQFYDVEPKVYIAYDRLALYGIEDAEFRVTFDTNIRSRYEELTLFCDENTTPLLKDGYYLMEVKIADAMPLWFSHILAELEIYNVSFSKYGNVYKRQMQKTGFWTIEGMAKSVEQKTKKIV